mgnify:CR=1 FL=1
MARLYTVRCSLPTFLFPTLNNQPLSFQHHSPFCPQKPSPLMTFTSPSTFTWQARRSPFSGLWGGNERRSFSAGVISLTCPSTLTAQVPHVPKPQQFSIFEVPLCGYRPLSLSTCRRLEPLGQCIIFPLKWMTGMKRCLRHEQSIGRYVCLTLKIMLKI